MHDGAQDSRVLEREARVFARYLVGRTPPAELIDRYREAHRIVLPGPSAPRDAAVVAFVRRHPWSAPFLDAASGFLRPGGLLRTKILLMAAILEASPDGADEFFPRPAPLAAFVVRLLGLGAIAVVRAALGIVLYPAAARSRP